jgi:hypothetical protein
MARNRKETRRVQRALPLPVQGREVCDPNAAQQTIAKARAKKPPEFEHHQKVTVTGPQKGEEEEEGKED